MKTRVHAIAGGIGFAMVLLFWTSTVISEVFASHDTVAAVKSLILQGMFILIPAVAIAGGSGMAMGKNRTDALANAKKRRMPIVAANGMLVLLPSAWFLAGRSAAGEFDTLFYVVQTIELVAGAANLTMMGLNIRDGLTMTGRIGGTQTSAAKYRQPVIQERPAGPLVGISIPRLVDTDGTEIETDQAMVLCRCGQSKVPPFCDNTHNEIGFSSDPSPDRAPDGVRVFSGTNIDVHYNRLLCSHAGECGARLKAVFDSGQDPWVEPDSAGADQIRDVIAACPSGALSWSHPGGTPQHIVTEKPGIVVEPNGPFRVTKIPLATGVQAEGACPEKYVLCRCGASKNKPFCDGSHVSAGWTG